MPSVATDSKLGAPRAFRPRSMILWSVVSGRSRLLYWNTIGIDEGSMPWSSRYSVISFMLWRFSCQRSVAEFATNTMLSAFFRSIFRVAP